MQVQAGRVLERILFLVLNVFGETICPYCLCNAAGVEESRCNRITEWSGLEGTSVGHPVQPSCRSRVTYSRL